MSVKYRSSYIKYEDLVNKLESLSIGIRSM